MYNFPNLMPINSPLPSCLHTMAWASNICPQRNVHPQPVSDVHELPPNKETHVAGVNMCQHLLIALKFLRYVHQIFDWMSFW